MSKRNQQDTGGSGQKRSGSSGQQQPGCNIGGGGAGQQQQQEPNKKFERSKEPSRQPDAGDDEDPRIQENRDPRQENDPRTS